MTDYSDKSATFIDAGFESGTDTCGAINYAYSSTDSTINWITLSTLSSIDPKSYAISVKPRGVTLATTYAYQITVSSVICPNSITARVIPLTIQVTTNCDPETYEAPTLPSEDLVFVIEIATPSATATRTIQAWN
jgi:hypothetical protein